MPEPDGLGASVAFDRAADYYDRTRAVSPRAMAGVVGLLAAEFRERGRVLEVGVGTGRIALPLAEAGVAVAGVDLSRPMMDRLVQKAGRRSPVPLAVADATTLPFAGGTFGAAYAAHVLHLIPAWPDAVRELVRVVRGGGVVLVDRGGWQSLAHEIGERFGQEAGVAAQVGMAVDEILALDELMASMGAHLRLLPEVENVQRVTLEEIIGSLERGEYSATWWVSESDRHRAAAAVRTWAAERYGDLTEPRTLRVAIRWRAYDLP